jgi:hypothetical protein
MSTFTKDDFLAWKNHAITMAMYEAVIERIEDAKESLVLSAGNDSLQDRFTSGMIRAFREVLALEFATEETTNA